MKILIIEDESRIAKRIERMTKEFFLNTLESITCLHTLSEGVIFIQQNKLDLVLLDLNLNGESGFNILKSSVSEAFHTIIISANKQEALTAFEYGVLDFIPKPFNKSRLDQAFNRIIKKEEVTTENLQFLAIKKRNGIQLISINEVIYIKGAGVYTEVYLTNGEKELHDKSLEKLTQLLPKTFYRIHKSYLVKITEIKELIIQSGSKYSIELKNNNILPVGRTRYKKLKESLL
ncbi:LytR/AlgR family response regulator transcription factor [Tenacibaculum sp. nBUS_03]|uniref:LytR/AlgR family response regulator transcription factor n=1 Tax=Tenacibaculum sp. nBUS_03 TaxID=3395320 RepID=UPI003EBA8DD6